MQFFEIRDKSTGVIKYEVDGKEVSEAEYTRLKEKLDAEPLTGKWWHRLQSTLHAETPPPVPTTIQTETPPVNKEITRVGKQ